jgi:AhpD family alkylhydroperoxidase
MIKDHSKRYHALTLSMRELGLKIPEVMSGFSALHKASITDGALSAKTKELIALGIAITVRCDGCIAYHVHDALSSGATSQEILETIGVAVLMGGGPAVVYGSEAMEALEQFIVLEKNETTVQ